MMRHTLFSHFVLFSAVPVVVWAQFAGLNQVNVRMPENASGGGTASVRLIYLERPSDAVTLNVQ
jgi:uncharacterized protein (TIGR03437 family)